MKLYKAVDERDHEVSMFLLYPSGAVAVMRWYASDEEIIRVAKDCANFFAKNSAKRFKDAIDPVLIAEW